jgi:2-oxo-hept-3-ene-1,7-dioate hydratase
MSLPAQMIAALAAELDHAERTRVALEHFSRRYPEMTVDDGYAIQKAWVALKCAAGRKVVGHKIGLTSRAMQMAAQITEPDFGALLDDMVFPPGDIPFNRFIAPMVEVELAFVLNRDLRGPNVTLEDVMRATEYVVPAIEIIDARIERQDRTTKIMRRVFDTISDNAANAGIVLGATRVKPDAINAPKGLDLRWTGAIMTKNGVVEETGLAAGVLGHPAIGIAWLANKLSVHGESLIAGEILLAGSFTRPVLAVAGDRFSVDYGEVFGTIDIQFV